MLFHGGALFVITPIRQQELRYVLLCPDTRPVSFFERLNEFVIFQKKEQYLGVNRTLISPWVGVSYH